MANDFFSASGNPATASQGSSATMRAEFASIEDGFDKLPALTGNGDKIVAINSGGTALEAVTTTGTGNAVRATSPTLVTPTLGVASATSINGTSIPSSATLLTSGGALGTPSSGTLTNCAGLPIAGIASLGTGVGTALAVNVGSSGAFVTNGGALGTPSSGTVTNLTGTASININGTVGATTPTTGAFTTVTASTQVVGPTGSASTPSLSFSGNTNAGFYISVDVSAPPNTNEISVSTYGARTFTFKNDRATMASAYHQTGTITATGTTPTLASGTYTPTITALTNVTGSTANTAQWTRVGNVVTVSGLFSIDPTSAAYTIFYVSLPIASDLSSVSHLGGSGVRLGDSSNNPVAIYGDITDDRAVFVFWASDGSNNYLSYTFTYVVL